MLKEYFNTLIRINEKVFFYINNDLSNSFFDYIMPIMRNLYTWFPLYFLLIIYFFIKFKYKGLIILASAVILIFLTDYGSASIIKPYFAMLRPCNNPDIKEHVRLLVHCGSGYSFISTHASNHFGLSTFLITSFCLFEKHKLIAFILLLWAFTVSFAQIYVGVHYPFDIITGAIYGSIIGILIGSLTKFFLTSKDDSK